jgi:hypothetical protein
MGGPLIGYRQLAAERGHRIQGDEALRATRDDRADHEVGVARTQPAQPAGDEGRRKRAGDDDEEALS